jgi:hypothetical protein
MASRISFSMFLFSSEVEILHSFPVLLEIVIFGSNFLYGKLCLYNILCGKRTVPACKRYSRFGLALYVLYSLCLTAESIYYLTFVYLTL